MISIGYVNICDKIVIVTCLTKDVSQFVVSGKSEKKIILEITFSRPLSSGTKAI